MSETRVRPRMAAIRFTTVVGRSDDIARLKWPNSFENTELIMTSHASVAKRLVCAQMSDPFKDLPKNYYGAILADPPWRFATWNKATAVQARGSKSTYKSATAHYNTMPADEIAALPVKDLAAENSVLFLWACWPMLKEAFDLIEAWGFTYKTCAFDWMKAHTQQIDIFRDDAVASMGMGYWTRANSEPCLLATRGKVKRVNADVRQGIIEPRREHSRKPECVHGRIQRLVAGPYLEMFARAPRAGWDVWGNQTDKFAEAAE